MSNLRPGGFDLTKDAFEQSGLKIGAKVLDVGCADGETLANLEEEFDVEGIGIDIDEDKINVGKKKHNAIELKVGDAEALEFPSRIFDGVFMECTLSLVNLQVEALHEAYCVLGESGKLIISDVYIKNPDPQEVLKVRREAIIANHKQREEGDCEDRGEILSEYMLDGAFVMDSLYELCDDIGFDMILWEDRSDELKSFLAEKIMEYGSVDKIPEGQFCDISKNKDIGYFLMVLKKREEV